MADRMNLHPLTCNNLHLGPAFIGIRVILIYATYTYAHYEHYDHFFSYVIFFLGGVLGKTRALRDETRFLGKESTVPVRLVYRTDNGQTAHDVLSTRVRANPGADQVSFPRYTSFSGVVYVFVFFSLNRPASFRFAWAYLASASG